MAVASGGRSPVFSPADRGANPRGRDDRQSNGRHRKPPLAPARLAAAVVCVRRAARTIGARLPRPAGRLVTGRRSRLNDAKLSGEILAALVALSPKNAL